MLYHARHPARAVPVERFDCGPHPDYRGEWEGGLRGGWVWGRILVALVAVGYLAAMAVLDVGAS